MISRKGRFVQGLGAKRFSPRDLDFHFFGQTGGLMHGGKALVRIFARAGVDYIFSSPGTEWPPVWEALAEAQERGDNRLRYINCRHEALAVAMASGYTRVTGKPKAVL